MSPVALQRGYRSSLRDPLTVALLLVYLARVCEKKGWRLLEYSIQTNHLHLICPDSEQEPRAGAPSRPPPRKAPPESPDRSAT